MYRSIPANHPTSSRIEPAKQIANAIENITNKKLLIFFWVLWFHNLVKTSTNFHRMHSVIGDGISQKPDWAEKLD